MISLAKPEYKMFNVLKETTMNHLIANFNSYKFTDSYLHLCVSLKRYLKLNKIKKNHVKALSKCFF